MGQYKLACTDIWKEEPPFNTVGMHQYASVGRPTCIKEASNSDVLGLSLYQTQVLLVIDVNKPHLRHSLVYQTVTNTTALS